MRAVLVSIAWLAFAGAASAQTEPDFYLISATGPAEAPTNVAMADATRVTDSAEGYRRMWTWTYFTQDSSPEVRSLVIVTEFDCPAARYRLVQITGRQWTGEPDTYAPDNTWRPVTPDSNASIMQSFACSTAEVIAGTSVSRIGNVNPDQAAAIILHLEQD